jgi:hypothetical protein
MAEARRRAASADAITTAIAWYSKTHSNQVILSCAATATRCASRIEGSNGLPVRENGNRCAV